MNLYHNLINLEFTIFFVFLFLVYFKFGTMKSFLIFIHLITIFMLNDFLFPQSYFGDQRFYVQMASSFRDTFDIPFIFQSGIKQGLPSLLFSLFPIPFVTTVQSLAMINFMIFLIIYLFIKTKFQECKYVEYFILLYPSLLLYTSLALRDTLILFFMITSIYYLIVKKRYYLGILFSFPLLIIKVQNFLMIYFALYLTFVLYTKIHKIKKLGLAIIPLGALFLLSDIKIARFTLGEYFTIEKLEFYRYNMFAESYNYQWELVSQLPYEPITSIFSFFRLGLINLIQILINPLPWSATNPLQLFQSIENLIILFIFVFLIIKKCDNSHLNYCFGYIKILLFVSMGIIGLVVYNYGAAARFKFPFVAIFIIYSILFLDADKLLKSYNYNHTKI